jgi:hypothetical protein
MAISLSPTLTAQRWGNKSCDLFEYYPHATRDAGGNPLIIYRHGGSGTSGTYQDDKTVDREVANFTEFATNSANGLGRHFDVLFLESAQRSLGSTVTSGNRLLMVSAVRDIQRAICEIKRLGVIGFGATNQYKVNPHQVGGMGLSWGAGAMMLTQLFPALRGTSQGRTFSTSAYRAHSFDSSLAFLIFNAGQPDIRKISTVDQIHYSNLAGYFGTSSTSSTEWDLIPNPTRESLSCLAYFANGDVPFCPPTAVLYNVQGTHAVPYGDPGGNNDIHDSKQGTDLVAALTAAGISNLNMQYAVTDAATGWQNGTAGKAVNCTALYNFIAGALNVAS